MLARIYRTLVATMVNLRFAVALLLTIAAASVAGTLIGAFVDQDAQSRFFKSLPFSLLMIVFMVALILAVLSRYPWKKTHIGWIMTHAGLVIIVIGHGITTHFAFSGHVDLFEGQSTDVAEGDRWYLVADLPELKTAPGDPERGTRVRIPFQLSEMPDVPIGRTYTLPSGDRLTIERYFPSYEEHRVVEPDFSSDQPLNPAVRLEITQRRGNDRQTLSEWLFAENPRESAKTFSSAFTTIYRRVADRSELEALLAERPAEAVLRAEPRGGAAPFDIPVDRPGDPPRPLGDSGWEVRVLKRFERLRIIDNKATEAAEGAPMPALQIELRSPEGKTDQRWLFALMPEADTSGSLEPPFTLRFKGGKASGPLAPSSLAILETPDGPSLRVLTDPQGRRRAGPLVLGEAIRVPWLDEGVDVTVADRYPRTRVSMVPRTANYTANRPAVLVTLDGARGPVTQWVVWSKPPRPTTFDGRSGPVHVRYAPDERPLGFTITLRDFVLKKYEGTNNPKSFESFVHVTPHDGDQPFRYHIYMNHVMDYNGWRFFQSSYDPETLARSIFTASYDPGKHVVYGGYLLTPLGLMFIVFVKPWLVRREAERRAAAGLAALEARRAAEGQGQAPMQGNEKEDSKPVEAVP